MNDATQPSSPLRYGVNVITPAIAQKLLKLNVGNRPLNRNHVKNLAARMARGEWRLNGEGILLNGDRLLDGQHRLEAVLLSGVAIETLVVQNVPSEAFHTLDQGRSRSHGDVLAMRGAGYANQLGSALRLVHLYESGSVTQKTAISNTQMLELARSHPGLDVLVPRYKRVRLAPCSMLAACHYLFAQKDEKAAEAFMHAVCWGAHLSPDTPAFTLRNRLLEFAISKAKPDRFYLFALMIKAWNAHRSGQALRRLGFREGADKSEGFPVIL